MNQEYDIKHSFPWDENEDEFPKNKTIAKNFDGVNILCSLIKTAQNPNLGIKITANSDNDFKIQSSINISIHKKKSNYKSISDFFNFVLSSNHYKAILYLSLPINEVKNYLVSKGEIKVLEIYFSISLTSQNANSRQKYTFKNVKSNKTTSKYNETQSDESSVTDDTNHTHSEQKTPKHISKQTQNDQKEKYRPENNDQELKVETKFSQTQKNMKKNKSQTQLKIKGKNEAHDDADIDIQSQKPIQKASTTKLIKKSQDSNIYDDFDETQNKKKKRSDKKNNYIDDQDQQEVQKKKSQNKSDKQINDEEDNDQQYTQKTHHEKLRRSTQNSRGLKDDIESDIKNDKIRKLSRQAKTQSQVQMLKNQSNYEYSDEDQKYTQKVHHSNRATKRRNNSEYRDDEDDDRVVTRRVNKHAEEEEFNENESKRSKNKLKGQTQKVKKKDDEQEEPINTQRVQKTEKKTELIRKKNQDDDYNEINQSSRKSNSQTKSSKGKSKGENINSDNEQRETKNAEKPKQRRRTQIVEKNKHKNDNDDIDENANQNLRKTKSNQAKELKEMTTKYDNECIEIDKERHAKTHNSRKTKKKGDDESSTKKKAKNQEEEISSSERAEDKEICPFIGLSNLGATCYMNSAIQVLFHTPFFRQHVLTFDTGITNVNDISTVKNAENKCKLILIHLQALFYQMINLMKDQSIKKFHKDYISTAQLTRSFGWSEQEIRTQQDVHEFMINFFEVLDECSKSNRPKVSNDGTFDDNSITGIFKGRIITLITRKKDDKILSHSFEDFYDFSLLVKGSNDIYQSLDLFTQKDILRRESKSDSNQLIQVKFYSLPKVLHIHLRRFVYSQELCRTNKVNDYFAFPDDLDLSPYVFTGNKKEGKKERGNNSTAAGYTGECNYVLYGVIVHQGKSSYIGHYYAYLKLNSNNDGNFKENDWYLFNDTKVRKVSKEEATKLNFGTKKGTDDDDTDDADSHCAYILIYVRKDAVNEIFMNPEIKIPKNVITCIDSLEHPNVNRSSQFFNTFSNAHTNATIGFTLITEDCVRMNCKLGKAGIDNRLICQRVNVPFDQFFTFSSNSGDKNGTFSAGGLYATVSVFLKVDILQLNLWTVSSSYEISELLNRFEYEISKEMDMDQIEKIKEKTSSQISPHVIFVEILQSNQDINEETEETEESSHSTIKHRIPIITKLYTRDLQCPMLYTGILNNISHSHSINFLVKHHYKKRLIEIANLSLSKESFETREKYISLINKMKFKVFYEKKRSNVKGDADLFELNLTKSLKSNHVPKGAFLIFSFKLHKNESDESEDENEDEQNIFELMNELIKYDKKMNNNYDFKTNRNTNNDAVVHRYCDMMLSECPTDPSEFCNMFTNTETFDVYRYFDNHYFGKVELPCKIALNKLSEFIAFQFETKYSAKDSKMLFFGDGPTLRPIEVSHQNDSSSFQITEFVRKSFFFSVVPKNFQYSDMCFTLTVIFSADSISQTEKFNFFVETLSEEEIAEIEEDEAEASKPNKNSKQVQLPANPYSKQTSANSEQKQVKLSKQSKSQKEKQTRIIKAESFENILNKVIENQTKIGLSDVRCFWISQETSQIVSDFIFIDSKKKDNLNNYIHEKDILILKRDLRIEVIPSDQKSSMKSINKMKLKNKDDYCGCRLEVYKSYVQDNFDENDENASNSLPLLKVFDFPIVLVNVENNLKVKKLKEHISRVFLNGKDKEKNDYLSIKYASLFIPRLEDNLFNKNVVNNHYENEEEEEEDKIPVNSTRDDFQFAFKATQILKNDDKIHLEKNKPNKLFLVYSQDRALGNANDGVVFY